MYVALSHAPSDRNPPPPAARISLAWLIRLRWGAVLGQLATLAVVSTVLGLSLPLGPMLLLVLATAASNLGARSWLQRGRQVGNGTVGLLLALDVALLTGLLYGSGGPSNPFSVLYLVHVALAAVMLPAAWPWILGALSLGAYAALFAFHIPLPGDHGHHGSDEAFSLHLQGMWVSFAVAAALISWFVTRVKASLGERDEELQAIRETNVRYEKLAAIGTLAAGAAHELGTPLGTIALVAGELERALTDERLLEDVRLIRSQVDRCQHILQGMRTHSPGGDELAPVDLATVLEHLGEGPWGDRLDLEIEPACHSHRVPGKVLIRILENLLGNAFDASPAEERVRIVTRTSGTWLLLSVADRGTGMSEAIVARAFDPFFTTKAPGKGMGLGLHLARTAAEQLGGAVDLQSALGRGTVVTLHLPLEGET